MACADLPRLSLLLMALVALLGAQEPVAKPEPMRIALRVRWEGEHPPAPAAVRLDPAWKERNPAEAKHCGRCVAEGRLVDESLLVDAKSSGLANVALSILGLEGPVTALKEPLLDNKDCRFEPRVLFAAVGHGVQIRNSDPFAHTARLSDHAGNVLWNAMISTAEPVVTKPLARAGSIQVLCDMHPWMKAHIIATRHPYVVVSNAEGQGQIVDVPSDKAELSYVAWHEKLGTARGSLRPKPGAVVAIDLDQRAFKLR
jgi:plastocyanin